MSGHGGAGLLRVSPHSAAQWSPAVGAGNNPSARRTRRFFDNPPGSVDLRNSKESATSPATEHEQPNDNAKSAGGTTHAAEVMDGIDLVQLRRLAKEALGMTRDDSSTKVSSLPSTAVFYASLLFAKSQSAEDCFLYAQALSRNGEAKRCVRLLEQSGLLDHPLPGSHVAYATMRMEAVLLAAEALSTLGEWQSVLELLEDACQLANATAQGAGVDTSHLSASHYFPLEDDDDMAWDSLFQTLENPRGYIHPLSRICLWRGRAYSETGHPQRAALYWKRAIRMDSKCVEALDMLLSRSVVTPQEAYDVIEGLSLDSGMEWLRNLYLSRIELSPQDVVGGDSSSLTGASETNTPSGLVHDNHRPTLDPNAMNMPASTPFAMDGHSHYLDASSIQMATPSMLQTPRGHDIPTDPNFHPMFGASSIKKSQTQQKGPVAAGGEGGAAIDATDGDSMNQNLPAKAPIQICVDEAFEKLWNVHKLHQSPEVLAMAARRAYRRYDLKGSLEHCQQLASIDPLCQAAGYVYISTLVALGHKRHLFRLAHEWVEASPKSARAWFAVGSYYYACERYHVAQRHFCRATRLDPHCTEAWIAFGCSFAACDESDQALASFRAAQRLSPGEYSSLLYMGMEYLRTNHLVLAHYFLMSAYKASGGDPLCLNELGVLAMQQSNYPGAIDWFSRALCACVQDIVEGDRRLSVAECIDLCQEKHWESTIFNLGQCYRKSRNFAEAAHCFERCVALSPVRVFGFHVLEV